MNCPTCKRPMSLLLFSHVCDYCDGIAKTHEPAVPFGTIVPHIEALCWLRCGNIIIRCIHGPDAGRYFSIRDGELYAGFCDGEGNWVANLIRISSKEEEEEESIQDHFKNLEKWNPSSKWILDPP